MKGEMLEIAERIARRLDEAALWSGETCTWLVRSWEGRTNYAAFVAAGGDLYMGSSGIALALGEVYAATGNDHLKTAAVGGIRHALALSRDGQPHLGFYSGHVGVAYAAARVGQIVGESEFVDAAARLLARLQGHADRDRSLDVIGGAAGAIGPLLRMSETPGLLSARDLALELGHQLRTRVNHHPEGWSWSDAIAAARPLTGLAHGAAGFGSALLELAAYTADASYRFAAAQAFAYERFHFDGQVQNWPDFRQSRLAEMVLDKRAADIRAEVRRGESFTWPPGKSMLAWCHGAPGIALTRWRAYELTGEESYREEAMLGTRVTSAAIQHLNPPNYSLCHGLTGDCETLLRGAAFVDTDDWSRSVDTCLLRGANEFELAGRAWPSGGRSALADSSLLVGDAGIAHFFARAAGADVPSILHVVPSSRLVAPQLDEPTKAARWSEELDVHFADTRRACVRLLGRDDPLLLMPSNTEPFAPALSFEQRLRERLATEPAAALREYLADASALELAGTELLGPALDRTGEYLEELMRDTSGSIDWDTMHWRLSSRARVVYSQWDWTTWLDASPAAAGPAPAAEPAVLVIRRGYQVEWRRVSAFAAAIFEELQQPQTLRGLLTVLVGPAAIAPVEMRNAAMRQLSAAYANGVVVQHWPILPRPATGHLTGHVTDAA